jgi:glycosyltransferase involved in cell wall biosynthesis
MKPLSPETELRFVVATPPRSVCDDNARALERHNLLRFIALGTRRGTVGVPPERTRLNPWIGLLTYAAARTLSDFRAVSFRYRLHPWFDRWVKRQLRPGDHIISSYSYANECFKFVQANGGKTFLDGGNSHPENFWNIIAEEHHRWNCSYPPMPRYFYERAVMMMEHVDYVLSPSAYVTRSFLARGFRPEQILRNVYPVDLSCFSPAREPRPAARPLTLICTGSLSLRKGTPYLLEAFRAVRRKIPNARLLLSRIVEDSMRPILSQYQDLPIDWSPGLPHAQLAERLRSADLFVLPSLEDGFARTVTEALACGLPVVTTPNTGACDLIESGVNGEVVPIRDPQAIADAVLKWADKILAPDWQLRVLVNTELLSFEHFECQFLDQLRTLGLVGPE